jgi:hypothetical protein
VYSSLDVLIASPLSQLLIGFEHPEYCEVHR